MIRYITVNKCDGASDVDIELDPPGSVVHIEQCEDCGSPPREPGEDPEFFGFVVGETGIRCENPECRTFFRWETPRPEVTWDADDGGPGQDYDSAYQDLCDPWGA